MTDKEYKAIQRIMRKVRKRTERKRLAHTVMDLMQAKITAWWRTKVTKRCCRTCEHWAPCEALENLAGRCQIRCKVNPAGKLGPMWTGHMTTCKTWRKTTR